MCSSSSSSSGDSSGSVDLLLILLFIALEPSIQVSRMYVHLLSKYTFGVISESEHARIHSNQNAWKCFCLFVFFSARPKPDYYIFHLNYNSICVHSQSNFIRTFTTFLLRHHTHTHSFTMSNFFYLRFCVYTRIFRSESTTRLPKQNIKIPHFMRSHQTHTHTHIYTPENGDDDDENRDILSVPCRTQINRIDQSPERSWSRARE